MQISCRNYVKPGKTIHGKGVVAETCYDVGETTVRSSSNIDRSSGQTQTHQYNGATSVKVSEPTSCTGNYFPSSNVEATEAGKSVGGQRQNRASTGYSSGHQVLGGSVGNHNVHNSQIKDSEKVLVPDMDDDEILEVILFS